MDEFTKFDLQKYADQSNIMNSSNTFNMTKSQFRKTLTGNDMLVPIYNKDIYNQGGEDEVDHRRLASLRNSKGFELSNTYTYIYRLSIL